MNCPMYRCPKCGHMTSFVTLADETGYCMYCCETTPLDELRPGSITQNRIFKNLYYCHDCDEFVILKSKWFRCPQCTSSRLTERDDFIHFDYSQKQLYDMLHKNGCFATAIKKLKNHNIDVRKTVFAPKLPENISHEDLITIVNLAVNAKIKKLIVPPNDYLD